MTYGLVRSAQYFPMISWTKYTRLFIEQFGEVSDDPIAELMRLFVAEEICV